MYKADKSQELERYAVVTQGGAMKQNGLEIGSHAAWTSFSRLKSYRLHVFCLFLSSHCMAHLQMIASSIASSISLSQMLL